jgi:hypothetical protein
MEQASFAPQLAAAALRAKTDHLLEATWKMIERGRVSQAIVELIPRLHEQRQRCSSADFARHVLERCRTHPLYARLAADPFTRRCRDKPRGYPGDAVMLDYIYEGLTYTERESVTEEGQRIFAMTAGSSASATAVRLRRTILARELDAVAARRPGGRVLSVACGHLREAALSPSVRAGRLGEIVALDQDPESLREVTRSAYGPCVRPLAASVSSLMKGGIDLGSFDLIYAAGLYDYLDQAAASRLTARLFACLSPGGRLLIGNFRVGFATQSYMEAFMDWRLITRTPDAMSAWFDALPAGQLQALELSTDPTRCVIYAAATRATAC